MWVLQCVLICQVACMWFLQCVRICQVECMWFCSGWRLVKCFYFQGDCKVLYWVVHHGTLNWVVHHGTLNWAVHHGTLYWVVHHAVLKIAGVHRSISDQIACVTTQLVLLLVICSDHCANIGCMTDMKFSSCLF